jgi:hypothetical protein
MTDINTDENSEQVLMRIKRHWIVLVRGFFLLFFLWFICIFGFVVASGIRVGAPLISVILFFVCFLLLVFAHHWIFLSFLGWELSIWVITTTRIISFTNIPYIENDINFVDIKEIEQIQQVKHGFLRNYLNYGTVIVQIPANQQQIVFENLPQPAKLANLVEAVQKNRSFESMTIEELEAFFRRKYEYLISKWCVDEPECQVEA